MNILKEQHLKTIKKLKQKKCQICKEPFQAFKSTQIVCSLGCALLKVHADKAKKSRQETRIAKVKAKGRREWLSDLQEVFNKFIRLRDRNEPCISCGRFHDGQYHAGHYLSVGSMPALRFDEMNVHKQCAPCNNHLSGNIVRYRPNLIQKIGIEQVEYLEGPHEPKKYTIEQIQELLIYYKTKIKEILNDNFK